MAMSLEAAASLMRDAMRETVKRYSLWYLLQGILMAAAGVLALIYPMLASVTMMVLLGWILIISGVVQGIGLIGAATCRIFGCSLFPSCSRSSSAGCC